MAGALKGLRIVDMTAVVLGPYAMQLLGDQGADIVKVEPPEGETLRYIGPSRVNPGMGPLHLGVNRSKRSLALDLKSEAGQGIFRRLIESADVLLEEFRPGKLAKLGFGYEQAREINPRLVYCSLSGYGQSGPFRDYAGHDINYLAMSGALRGDVFLSPTDRTGPGECQFTLDVADEDRAA